jgi:hypothetical protein
MAPQELYDNPLRNMERCCRSERNFGDVQAKLNWLGPQQRNDLVLATSDDLPAQ